MLPEKIVWMEGMAVSPVHFQQQDRYFDAQIRLRAAMFHPHAWGFTEYAVDEQHLTFGKIVLSKAAGILPDGTLFETGHGQGALSLDVPPGSVDRRVVLALPMAVEGGTETRDDAAMGLSTRFIRAQAALRDHNAYKNKSNREVPIFCGRQDLQLLFDDDSGFKGFIAMPLAHIVECRQDKSILLDKDFTPPCLHLDAAPSLMGHLREIIGLLSHRGDHLAARIGSGGQTGAAEIADFLLLQCINRMEPAFRHLERTRGLHPEEFYQQLLHLVGELATFAEDAKRPREIAPYDHAAQHVTFDRLMQQARFSLGMVLEQHAVRLPMQPPKNNVSLAPLHDKSLLHTAFFILVARADMDVEQLRSQLPRQVKIGTPENIRELVNSQLPGVNTRPLSAPPRQMRPQAGTAYFQLEFSPKQRSQFDLSTGFAVHVPGAFPGLHLELWAVKE